MTCLTCNIYVPYAIFVISGVIEAVKAIDWRETSGVAIVIKGFEEEG